MTIWSKRNGHWKQVSGTSQADKSAIWGRISGSIRSQTDLMDKFDSMLPKQNGRGISIGDTPLQDATVSQDGLMTKEQVKDLRSKANQSDLKPLILDIALRTIGPSTFFGGVDVYVAKVVSYVGYSAFNSATFKTSGQIVSAPLEYIDVYAFAYTNITEVRSSGNATEIYLESFAYCESLKTVDMSAVRISTRSFADCPLLDTVIMRTSEPPYLTNTNPFENTPISQGTGYIYVPDESVDAYKNATNWTVYASQIKPLSALPAEASA